MAVLKLIDTILGIMIRFYLCYGAYCAIHNYRDNK